MPIRLRRVSRSLLGSQVLAWPFSLSAMSRRALAAPGGLRAGGDGDGGNEFGDAVRDSGLSAASIQAATISRRQSSNLFWCNVAMGAAMTLGFVALAPVLGARVCEAARGGGHGVDVADLHPGGAWVSTPGAPDAGIAILGDFSCPSCRGLRRIRRGPPPALWPVCIIGRWCCSKSSARPAPLPPYTGLILESLTGRFGAKGHGGSCGSALPWPGLTS